MSRQPRVSGLIALITLAMPVISGPLMAEDEPAPGSGLVAHWKFDGDFTDSVGGHALVPMMNSLGRGRLDPMQKPPFMDGQSGLALFQRGNVPGLQTPAAPDLDMNHDFTLSVWAYRENSIYDNDAIFHNGALYLAKRDAHPWNSRMGIYVMNGDRLLAELVDDSPMGAPPVQTWFHVVVYRSGNTMGIRVNDQGTATVDVTGMTLGNDHSNLVGVQRYGYAWQGRLDELCIWNRALTGPELTDLYDSGPAIPVGIARAESRSDLGVPGSERVTLSNLRALENDSRTSQQTLATAVPRLLPRHGAIETP